MAMPRRQIAPTTYLRKKRKKEGNRRRGTSVLAYCTTQHTAHRSTPHTAAHRSTQHTAHRTPLTAHRTLHTSYCSPPLFSSTYRASASPVHPDATAEVPHIVYQSLPMAGSVLPRIPSMQWKSKYLRRV